MALLKLSLVTESLTNLLQAGFQHIFELNPLDYEIVAQSPEQIPNTIDRRTVSVYLYHAREDPHYKNAEPRPGVEANTPLALSLYYVVTAHFYDGDQKPDCLEEQNLLGYALKLFHDYPVLKDSTAIEGTDILPTALRDGDNHLQIIYRPLTPEDATTFWNSDDERLIRFSAFYEVRVVLVRPAAATHIPGYVLTVGNYVAPTGVMHIASSHSVVQFTPPGGTEVSLAASPARVALLNPLTPATLLGNRLELRGARLGGGQLVLRSPRFQTPGNLVVVDPALNPTWSIEVTASRVTARVRRNINTTEFGTQHLEPGGCGVSVQVSNTYALPGGLSKTLVSRSNEVGILVTPFIAADYTLVGPAPALVSLNVNSDTDLLEPPIDELDFYVSGERYTRVLAGPALREYRVMSSSNLMFTAPFGNDTPGAYPVRLVIRGAESQPFWIVVT